MVRCVTTIFPKNLYNLKKVCVNSDILFRVIQDKIPPIERDQNPPPSHGYITVKALLEIYKLMINRNTSNPLELQDYIVKWMRNVNNVIQEEENLLFNLNEEYYLSKNFKKFSLKKMEDLDKNEQAVYISFYRSGKFKKSQDLLHEIKARNEKCQAKKIFSLKLYGNTKNIFSCIGCGNLFPSRDSEAAQELLVVTCKLKDYSTTGQKVVLGDDGNDAVGHCHFLLHCMKLAEQGTKDIEETFEVTLDEELKNYLGSVKMRKLKKYWNVKCI